MLKSFKINVMNMKKIILLFSIVIFSFSIFAQESNNGKKLWAKSVLNQKAPELVVEEWVTKIPKTKGKFVLIDFWGTGCAPCRKLIPELNKWSKLFKKDLVVIGLVSHSVDALKRLKEPVVEYYSGADEKKRMLKELEIKGVPHVILIDPRGIVRWEGYPLLEGHELTAEIIEKLIKKYKK